MVSEEKVHARMEENTQRRVVVFILNRFLKINTKTTILPTIACLFYIFQKAGKFLLGCENVRVEIIRGLVNPDTNNLSDSVQCMKVHGSTYLREENELRRGS